MGWDGGRETKEGQRKGGGGKESNRVNRKKRIKERGQRRVGSNYPVGF